ncbi:MULTISPECIES: hypothetical protein [unclassified Streptomyces]|uniref:hypothetical protein n=1 Tax=unclassified Streptomyces TaxID=2593676 RepID=UPI0006AF1984|nr:hypothetical protein [Streptomyces sp. WM6378]KOU41045.1 hypothetical protein ADK54_21035 [Streptomyces sp. WM6378]
MRKFQQAMIAAVAAAGGLAAVGAGAGTASAHEGVHQNDHYRPYQECSPQAGAEANTPLSVLGLSDTLGTTCGQFNQAFTK